MIGLNKTEQMDSAVVSTMPLPAPNHTGQVFAVDNIHHNGPVGLPEWVIPTQVDMFDLVSQAHLVDNRAFALEGSFPLVLPGPEDLPQAFAQVGS